VLHDFHSRIRTFTQELKGEFEPDDYHAFNARKKFDAESGLEKTLKNNGS
jgi:hypothetical protein